MDKMSQEPLNQLEQFCIDHQVTATGPIYAFKWKNDFVHLRDALRLALQARPSQEKELKLTVCSKCDRQIDDLGLCSFACEMDDTLLRDRPSDAVKIEVYRLHRTSGGPE